MQGEHEAALQSLENASIVCLGQIRHSQEADQQISTSPGNSDLHATQPERPLAQHQKADSATQQLNGQLEASESPAGKFTGPAGEAAALQGLAVKVLLAKASILRQLQRHNEASDSLSEAKKLDPAVRKYVKS